MRDPQADGGGFGRKLKTASDLFESPRVAVVAASRKRAESVRKRCPRIVERALEVTTHTPGAARVALDASVAPKEREEFRGLVKKKTPSCRVLEITRWTEEPPA
jgi:hypothetical protein